jgi:hypothetical protein
MVPNKCVRQLHDCGYQFIEKYILACRKNAQPEASNTLSNVYNRSITRSQARSLVSGTAQNLNGATEPFRLYTRAIVKRSVRQGMAAMARQ